MSNSVTTQDQAKTYRARVLVIDDSTDTAAILKLLLKHEGYLAKCAHNGPEAIEAAIEFMPDIVLLDLTLLPSMNGVQVAEAIRKIPNLQTTIIAVTGWDPSRHSPQDLLFDNRTVRFKVQWG